MKTKMLIVEGLRFELIEYKDFFELQKLKINLKSKFEEVFTIMLSQKPNSDLEFNICENYIWTSTEKLDHRMYSLFIEKLLKKCFKRALKELNDECTYILTEINDLFINFKILGNYNLDKIYKIIVDNSLSEGISEEAYKDILDSGFIQLKYSEERLPNGFDMEEDDFFL